MKLRNQPLMFFAMTVLAAVFLGGCASSGLDRSTKTSNSVKDVDSEIRKVDVLIDATSKSLDTLVKADKANLKKSFKAFSDNLAKLDKEGGRMLRRIEEMKSQSKEYFAEWEKQGDSYTNPELRELSDQRRNKLAEIYAQVPAALTGVKGAYLQYMTDLKEIHKYLANDLTPDGVASITPIINKTVQDLGVLKTSLQPVLTALDEIKAELYSGKK